MKNIYRLKITDIQSSGVIELQKCIIKVSTILTVTKLKVYRELYLQSYRVIALPRRKIKKIQIIGVTKLKVYSMLQI